MKSHGDYIRYSTGCRCETCRDAWRVHRKAYRARLRARGLSEKRGDTIMVDAKPSRAFLTCMLRAGITKHGLSRATGINRHNFTFIQRGDTERVRLQTKEAIERVHWLLWRNYAPLRNLCRCDVPNDVLQRWAAA